MKRFMKKHLRHILLAVCIIVFLISAGKLLSIYYEYHVGEKTYSEGAKEFVTEKPSAPDASQAEGNASQVEDVSQAEEEPPSPEPPIQVDFESLKEANPDIIGWIYCEDTVINYPVLQGESNNTYLRHLYDGTYNTAGSIFVECTNQRDFADANTIIYGHHMHNGSMFACLDSYKDQDYYEAHPVMWLLTPEQNYKIVLFSSYTTSSDSDTYTIFSEPGEDLDTYISECLAKSDFTADVSLENVEKFVVLSTCAYDFDNARYVVHGALVPVETATE